ncbi:hypothetical protein [Streptomyces collinus]|uniref:hypothetical protein n=1 Tax=Streptomyces collinus TaxID=42684 RepID=UPI00332A9210
MSAPAPVPAPRKSRLKRIVLTGISLATAGGLAFSCSGSINNGPTDDHSSHNPCTVVFSPHTICDPQPLPPSGPTTQDPKPQEVGRDPVGVPAQVRRSGPATIYSTPSVHGGVLYELDPGQKVHIICQEYTEVVRSPHDNKPSALWDEIGDHEWAPDAMIDTNEDGPVTRFCDGH